MSARLSTLLAEIPYTSLTGDLDTVIEGVASDSRLVRPGYAYVAVTGLGTDGHSYIPSALKSGARVIVVERNEDYRDCGAIVVTVPDTAEAAGQLASAFHGHPGRDMTVVGVTGTNGKTTTATILHQSARALGVKAGLLSTIKNIIVDQVQTTNYTTPDSVTLHGVFAQMKEAGCTHVFMEVSSHAVHQRRIAGVEFDGGVFSNLTQDHLDYHKTMDEYFAQKRRFFEELPSTAFALANIDDEKGLPILQATSARRLSYSMRNQADFMIEVVGNTIDGLKFSVNGKTYDSRLVGRFNAYNLGVAVAVCEQLGFDLGDVDAAISGQPPVDGRFDVVRSEDGRIGVVDFAHTPDGLNNLVEAAREVFADRLLVLVLGCGGDRDNEKRREMGRIASSVDCSVFTTDNPRTEDPSRIVSDMLSGVPISRRDRIRVVLDRREAIHTAVRVAGSSGVVLVAGKGHEKTMEIGGKKVPFYDKDALAAALE